MHTRLITNKIKKGKSSNTSFSDKDSMNLFNGTSLTDRNHSYDEKYLIEKRRSSHNQSPYESVHNRSISKSEVLRYHKNSKNVTKYKKTDKVKNFGTKTKTAKNETKNKDQNFNIVKFKKKLNINKEKILSLKQHKLDLNDNKNYVNKRNKGLNNDKKSKNSLIAKDLKAYLPKNVHQK